MRLAIVIDVDGDVMYVPENTHGFVNFPKPKLFYNLKDAEDECAKWNTGIIVDFDNNNKTVPRIRSFDDDERQRAKKREEINNGE